ncbi:hypothetical protein [Maridesulfovibrio salexigens]|uniref:SUEL-type lectin domain-containing protein n=1 Tax=Maridesulfovibrio salexigens (strain ATCC 14822 / DSM 2638 / NCIMB 8403 / VKM B-1763) TaxID=526222 RepID=C6C1I3_MARSD|nr:hypothetical protein [Maridesulfovibrio salexigens]ACS81158.1 hypothetical protein Desal_3107 [Maridesulfovibrio salexigens DSM 2638]
MFRIVFILMLLGTGLLVCVPHLQAEMKITLKDGKVIEVPVSEKDVKSIEYGNPQAVPEGVVPEKAIRVQSAKYGNISFELEGELGYKQYFCNAKETLVKECNGKNKCRVIVGNTICGDPYPGKGKYLYVEYTCGRKLKRAKKSQTEVMVLSCP